MGLQTQNPSTFLVRMLKPPRHQWPSVGIISIVLINAPPSMLDCQDNKLQHQPHMYMRFILNGRCMMRLLYGGRAKFCPRSHFEGKG